MATIAPSARNGPNGTAVLRPGLGALTRDDDGADQYAGDQRDQQRRSDRGAEEQPHHARELDVAHAHTAGIGERR